MTTARQIEALRGLGARLKTVRERHGAYSQRAASRKLGRHPQFVWRAEEGRSNPTFLVLCEFADLYGMDVAELLEGTGRAGAE